jgi:excisionase family DNA binding protein
VNQPSQAEVFAALDVIRRLFAAPTAAAEQADPWVDAAHAPISQRTIRNAVRAGTLEGSRVGGRLLVRRSALDSFIAAARVRPAAEPSAALAKLGAKRRAS